VIERAEQVALAQSTQGRSLDLPRALVRQAQAQADLAQRVRTVALQPKAQLQHQALPLRQRCQRRLDLLMYEGPVRHVVG
jgi:hypothetical protein